MSTKPPRATSHRRTSGLSWRPRKPQRGPAVLRVSMSFLRLDHHTLQHAKNLKMRDREGAWGTGKGILDRSVIWSSRRRTAWPTYVVVASIPPPSTTSLHRHRS